jgi:hypothetical protein
MLISLGLKARFLVFFLAAVGLTPFLAKHELTIEVDADLRADDFAEIFFSFVNEPFIQDNSITLFPNRSRVPGTLLTTLVTDRPITHFRLDPFRQVGFFEIRSIIARGPGGTSEWRADTLKQAPSHHIALVAHDELGVVFKSFGNDPQLHFVVPESITRRPAAHWFTLLVPHLAIFLTVWLGSELMVRLYQKRATIRARSNDLAILLSDPSTIEFRASSLGVFAGLFVLTILFITLGLNQSSLGVWDNIYGPKTDSPSMTIGKPKAIRSDEWNTQTPWILNQAQRGLEPANTNIGGEKSAFVAGTPVAGLPLLIQPKFWGIRFLDLTRGFSWIWAYKAFGLFGSTFLLLLFLTRGDTILSFTGALWLFGSSFVQWWYSSHLPEILIGFFLLLVGSLYLTLAQKLGGIFAGGALLLYAASTLLFHVYPPFIIPLVYLGLFVWAALSLSQEGISSARVHLRTRLLVASFVLVATVAFALFWASVAKDTILLMMNTVYPGERRALGGDLSLMKLFYGFFEGLRVSESVFPTPHYNASEASSFLLFFPLLLFLFRPNTLRNRIDRLTFVLLLYCLLLMVWISFPFPLVAREALAALGWGMTTPKRAVLGLGVASVFAVILFVSSKSSCRDLNQIARLFTLLGVTLAVAAWGFYLQHFDPAFFHNGRLALGIFGSALLGYSLVYRNRPALLSAVLIFSLPALTVNPIQMGISSITKKPILELARQQGGLPGDRWVVMGDFVFAQGMKSTGLDVLNGSQFAPNMPWLRVLDPEGLYDIVWNRYAHVVMISDSTTIRPTFELNQPDLYSVRVNVCGSGLWEPLRVTHVAYTYAVPPEDLKCLVPLGTVPGSGVSLFELIIPDRSTEALSTAEIISYRVCR